MSFLEKLKDLLNPKRLLLAAIESLDLLVPLLAKEIESGKERLNTLNSLEKSQWLIDKVQDFLRRKFNA